MAYFSALLRFHASFWYLLQFLHEFDEKDTPERKGEWRNSYGFVIEMNTIDTTLRGLGLGLSSCMTGVEEQ